MQWVGHFRVEDATIHSWSVPTSDVQTGSKLKTVSRAKLFALQDVKH